MLPNTSPSTVKTGGTGLVFINVISLVAAVAVSFVTIIVSAIGQSQVINTVGWLIIPAVLVCVFISQVKRSSLWALLGLVVSILPVVFAMLSLFVASATRYN